MYVEVLLLALANTILGTPILIWVILIWAIEFSSIRIANFRVRQDSIRINLFTFQTNFEYEASLKLSIRWFEKRVGHNGESVLKIKFLSVGREDKSSEMMYNKNFWCRFEFTFYFRVEMIRFCCIIMNYSLQSLLKSNC